MGDQRRTTRCGADELAITTNISIALATIASCLNFTGERRQIILSELDFPTDGHVWLAQAQHALSAAGGSH